MDVIRVDLLYPLNFSLYDNYSNNLQELSSKISDHFGTGRNFSFYSESLLVISYLIVIVFGLLTNSIIIFIINYSKNLKSPHNFLILNLNVSDLILCAVCSPSTLCQVITTNWFQGLFLCKFVPFVQATASFASTGTVAMITVQRLETMRRCDLRKNSFTITPDFILKAVMIWAFALFLSAPIAIYRSVVEVEISGIHLFDRCIETWENAKLCYSCITFIYQFLIPAILLIVTHAKFHNFLKETQTVSAGVKDAASVHHLAIRNSKVLTTLFTVWLTFSLSWLPLNVFNLYLDFSKTYRLTSHQIYAIFAVCHLIAMSSTVSNAVLYGWLNTAIRKEIFKLSCFRRCLEQTTPNENYI